MLRRVLSLIVLIAAVTACHQNQMATDISAPTQALVAKMENDTFIGTRSIGRTMGESPEYTRRKALADNATTTELTMLAKHENPIVAMTSFEALVDRQYADVIPFLEYYYQQPQKIHYIKGDLSEHMSTLHYAYEVILEIPLDIDKPIGPKGEESGITPVLREKYVAKINEGK